MPRSAKTKRNRGKAAQAGTARRQRKWLRTVLFYLLFPIVVWFVAFLLWFYWPDVTGLYSKDKDKPTTATTRESKPETRGNFDSNSKKPLRSQEKILDEDRRKLEDILKQRQ